MGTTQDSERTKSRLIEAAGKLFAEHGFHGVTVREIVGLADTHLSALNYHFIDKRGLYHAVLHIALESQTTLAALHQAAATPDTPAAGRQALVDLLTAIATDYGAGEAAGAEIGESTRERWQGRLVARELLDPTPDFLTLFRPLFEAVFTSLRRFWSAATAGSISDDESAHSAQGVTAQDDRRAETAEQTAQGTQTAQETGTAAYNPPVHSKFAGNASGVRTASGVGIATGVGTASPMTPLLLLVCLDALLTHRGILAQLVPEIAPRFNSPTQLAHDLISAFLPPRN